MVSLTCSRHRSRVQYCIESAQGLANADHTTLLLNCYTKLKDVAKLDAFLRGAGAADGSGALPFDVETAVKAFPALPHVVHMSSQAECWVASLHGAKTQCMCETLCR